MGNTSEALADFVQQHYARSPNHPKGLRQAPTVVGGDSVKLDNLDDRKERDQIVRSANQAGLYPGCPFLDPTSGRWGVVVYLKEP